MSQTGKCLCGAVSFSMKQVPKTFGACHCTTCRTWGGGPLMAADCGTDVAFTGGEHISVYDSSQWADRGFCRSCGTHLFYRLKQQEQYIIPVGLLSGDFEFHGEVFIDEKPDYYCFADKTEKMTGAEVFAKYGG